MANLLTSVLPCSRIFLDLILRTENQSSWKFVHAFCLNFVCNFYSHHHQSFGIDLYSQQSKKFFTTFLQLHFVTSMWNYSSPFQPLTQYIDRPIHTNILARNFRLFCLLKFKTIRGLWVTFVNSGHKFESKKKFQQWFLEIFCTKMLCQLACKHTVIKVKKCAVIRSCYR